MLFARDALVSGPQVRFGAEKRVGKVNVGKKRFAVDLMPGRGIIQNNHLKFRSPKFQPGGGNHGVEI
jgi:hypothetical protein